VFRGRPPRLRGARRTCGKGSSRPGERRRSQKFTQRRFSPRHLHTTHETDDGRRRAPRRGRCWARGLRLFRGAATAPPPIVDEPRLSAVEEESLITVDGDYRLWPYTSRDTSVEGRTLAINVLVHADAETTRHAIERRTGTDWEETEEAGGGGDRRRRSGAGARRTRLGGRAQFRPVQLHGKKNPTAASGSVRRSNSTTGRTSARPPPGVRVARRNLHRGTGPRGVLRLVPTPPHGSGHRRPGGPARRRIHLRRGRRRG